MWSKSVFSKVEGEQTATLLQPKIKYKIKEKPEIWLYEEVKLAVSRESRETQLKFKTKNSLYNMPQIS